MLKVADNPVYLSDFRDALFGKRISQDSIFELLAERYARDFGEAPDTWKRRFERFGCDSKQIHARACVNWSLSEVDYASETRAIFPGLLSADEPDDLFHVSCTGYVSPSTAQQFASESGWCTTRVTHLYHMGCYAAIPAIRLATNSVRTGSRVCQIVHTELCSSHFSPSRSPEQWVIQSLFADGAIGYTAGLEMPKRGLELLRTRERQIPGTASFMTWTAASPAFLMTLSKEVPKEIRCHLRAFTEDLMRDLAAPTREVIYAVHPGGPHILQTAAEVLELAPEQIAASEIVLKQHGNMSSATLPTVWKSLLESPAIQPGTPIVSLAFGPGLTICGSVMRMIEA